MRKLFIIWVAAAIGCTAFVFHGVGGAKAVGGFLMMMIPLITAFVRDHRNMGAIIVAMVCAAFTTMLPTQWAPNGLFVLTWIVCSVWASMASEKQPAATKDDVDKANVGKTYWSYLVEPAS